MGSTSIDEFVGDSPAASLPFPSLTLGCIAQPLFPLPAASCPSEIYRVTILILRVPPAFMEKLCSFVLVKEELLI